jgi:hypothetical protein
MTSNIKKVFDDALKNQYLDLFYLNLLELVEVSKTTKQVNKRTAREWYDTECFIKGSELRKYRKLKGTQNYNHNHFCEINREYLNLTKTKKLNYDLKQEEVCLLTRNLLHDLS